MVASRLANLEHGQKKADTEISVSQPEAAKLLNVSTDSVQFARKVLDQGSEALIQKVDAGELAVSAAAKIAELPEEEQVEIVSLSKEEIKKHVLAMKHTKMLMILWLKLKLMQSSVQMVSSKMLKKRRRFVLGN
jgi:hypothetical protein